MATKSIFDLESVDTRSEPKRQQITYDDDCFEFGCAKEGDEVDAAPKNVSISVSFDPNEVNGRKNGKRKARTAELDRERAFKVAKTNGGTNGANRRDVEPETPSEQYELIREIGCGTYGKVYKARWNSTKEIIAIKRFKCKLNVQNVVIFNRQLDRQSK